MKYEAKRTQLTSPPRLTLTHREVIESSKDLQLSHPIKLQAESVLTAVSITIIIKLIRVQVSPEILQRPVTLF